MFLEKLKGADAFVFRLLQTLHKTTMHNYPTEVLCLELRRIGRNSFVFSSFNSEFSIERIFKNKVLMLTATSDA